MSSPGSRRRSLDQFAEVRVQLAARALDGLARGLAGPAELRIVLADDLVGPAEQQLASRRSGTPRIHAITASGNGAAMRSTKSNSLAVVGGAAIVEDLERDAFDVVVVRAGRRAA